MTTYHWFYCHSVREGFSISFILLATYQAIVVIGLLFKMKTETGKISAAPFVLTVSHLAAFLIILMIERTDVVFTVLGYLFFVTNLIISCCFLPDFINNAVANNVESTIRFVKQFSTH